MELLVKKQIGRTAYHFNFSGPNLYEVLMESQKLSFDSVHKCGLCGSEELELTARLAQNKFKYVGVKCRACRGEITMGKRQEDADTYYLRKDAEGKPEWKAYNPNEPAQ